MLSDSALTTFANVQTASVGKEVIPAGQQATVEAMINAVSRQIATACYRTFLQQSYVNEPHHGTTNPRLRLQARPILSVQNVTRVTAPSTFADVIPATDYEVHSLDGYLYREYGWGPDLYPVRRSIAGALPHDVAVSYTAGYVMPGMYPATAPAITALTPGTGGTLAPGTLYYAVTAVWSNGIESIPSASAAVTLVSPNTQVSVAWSAATPPSGLTVAGYRVYRSAVPMRPIGFELDAWTWPATGPTWYPATASPLVDTGAVGTMGIPPCGVPEDLEWAAIQATLHVYLMRDKVGRRGERTMEGHFIAYDWIPAQIWAMVDPYRSIYWGREQ